MTQTAPLTPKQQQAARAALHAHAEHMKRMAHAMQEVGRIFAERIQAYARVLLEIGEALERGGVLVVGDQYRKAATDVDADAEIETLIKQVRAELE